ncbi:MAG: hypothetical protein ACI9NT_000952 [Bacteroidia bacterium]|jgi:hypothetical protein
MTLAELGNIGEVLSGAAVLVSLVYLIVEVRRNTKATRCNSAFSSTVALAELCEVIGNNPQMAELVMRALDADANPDDFTPAEFAQNQFISRSVLYKYEAQWYLWREGSLSDEMWQNRRRWAKAYVPLPVGARVWEIEKLQHQYADGFIESIDSASEQAELGIRN